MRVCASDRGLRPVHCTKGRAVTCRLTSCPSGSDEAHGRGVALGDRITALKQAGCSASLRSADNPAAAKGDRGRDECTDLRCSATAEWRRRGVCLSRGRRHRLAVGDGSTGVSSMGWAARCTLRPDHAAAAGTHPCMPHPYQVSKAQMLRTIPRALHSPAEAAGDAELTQARVQSREQHRGSMGGTTQHKSAAPA